MGKTSNLITYLPSLHYAVRWYYSQLLNIMNSDDYSSLMKTAGRYRNVRELYDRLLANEISEEDIEDAQEIRHIHFNVLNYIRKHPNYTFKTVENIINKK